MTHSDCYEKGHTPDLINFCVKCGHPLYRVIPIAGSNAVVWHTQAELDRLWQGVDREASRVLGEEKC